MQISAETHHHDLGDPYPGVPEPRLTIDSPVDSQILLEPDFVDGSLHPIRKNDFCWKISSIPGDEAQHRSILHPSTPQSIHLSVRGFEQPEHYSYFLYNQDQPEMVAYDDCIVCGSRMQPMSCLSNEQGKQFLTIGLCLICGFMQHTRRPPKEWYAGFYRKMWDPKKRQESAWPTTLALRTQELDRVFSYLKPGARVLEIGAGWGGSLVAFMTKGFECYGIEATEHRSEFIRSRLGIPCFTGEAENLPIGQGSYQPGTFDLIFSTHVLEHVYNNRQVLEHTYSLLKESGMALLEVPQYYSENLVCVTHDMSHTCNSSRDNFLFLLETIGFELVRDFSEPFNIRLLVRKSQPISSERREERLREFSTYLPHRGLAYFLDKSGLSRMPKQLEGDLAVQIEWYQYVWGRTIRFIQIRYDFLRQFTPHLNALRMAIQKRKPLELVSHLLPIQFVYRGQGVPIWYY